VHLPQSPDVLVDELAHRVEISEQEKRRWKRIGVSALAALVLLLLSVAGAYSYMVFQAHLTMVQVRKQTEQALRGIEQYRQHFERFNKQWEQAREQMEQDEREADRVVEELRRRPREGK
jgi:hypothetical protein